MKKRLIITVLCFVLAVCVTLTAGCILSPAPAPDPTPDATAMSDPTAAPTPLATPTPTPAQTPEPTQTPTPSLTPTPSPTPNPTPTPTPNPTPTPMPTATPTPTPTPTPRPTPAPAPTPTPTPTPEQTPTPPPASTNFGALISEVLRLTNIERENHDLSALSGSNGVLNSAAAIRATEIITSFAHTRPDGRTPWTAYTELGGSYSALGENLASGYRSAAGVVQGWMDSPGHRTNILSPDYTHLGVAVAEDENGRLYWVQFFMG